MSSLPQYPRGHRLLDRRTVVVTAAAGTGIGFATAKRCAEEGALVVLSDRHERRLAESAEQLGGVLAVPCDVTKEEDVQRLFDMVVSETGGLDVLVNNAGLGGTAVPTERNDEPWEVANVIVFLASDYSSYMTGEVVSVSSQHP